jgi:RNA polymerase sigma-70 factor (ECF subfamily)
MTEIDIVRLAQTGDAAAFEHLYKAHRTRVYSVCLRMTGNPSLAEDLTQETFLLVYRKIQSFRGQSTFSTWLYRVSVNVVLMKQRIKRPNETPLEERTCQTEGDDLHVREFGVSDPQLSSVVDRVILKGALRQLPRGYKKVFLLHDCWGYEHREIAEVLGCAIGTSKSQLHKARLRLRKIIRSGS